MSDPIESEVLEEASPEGELIDEELEGGETEDEDGGEAEEAAATPEPAPRRDEPSTLELMLALEQAEKRAETAKAITEEKRVIVIVLDGNIAATQAELARIDKLDNLTLEDVHVLENTRRHLRKLEAERVAALSNLEAANVELDDANKALDLAELAEGADRLKRLSDSVGATILLFSAHLRALCKEVLEFADEVSASAPFGYTFQTPPGLPFRSVMGANVPEIAGPGYPRSGAIETEQFLRWLIDVVKLTGGNGPKDETAHWHRWAAADPILPREEPNVPN